MKIKLILSLLSTISLLTDTISASIPKELKIEILKNLGQEDLIKILPDVIQKNDLEMVDQLIKAGAPSAAALAFAIKSQNYGITKALIDKKVDVNKEYFNEKPMLRLALDTLNPKIIGLVLEAGADVGDRTALINDKGENYLENLKKIADLGPYYREYRIGGVISILSYAIINYNITVDPIFKMLLIYSTNEEDLNNVDYTERPHRLSPLMLATIFARPRMIVALLLSGANKDLKNKEGKTALDFVKYADKESRPELTKLLTVPSTFWTELASSKVEMLPKNPDRLRSRLIKAIEKNDLAMVNKFIKEGAPVNPKENNFLGLPGIPLAKAIILKNYEIIKALIDNKANVNEVFSRPRESGDAGGMSMLRFAMDTLDPEIVELLLKSKAKVGEYTNPYSINGKVDYLLGNENFKSGKDLNKYYHTIIPLLSYAIINYNITFDPIFKMLLQYADKKDINELYTNFYYLTPLMLATIFARPDMVKALLDSGAIKNLKNKEDKTALDFVKYADKASQKKLTELLS